VLRVMVWCMMGPFEEPFVRRPGSDSMKVTLMRLAGGGPQQSQRYSGGHLGLGYIAACLLQRGHQVRVLDGKKQTITEADVRQHIREFQPQIFGVTAMTHEIHGAARACEGVKAEAGDIVTIVGGPHTTALPERTLEEFPAVDLAAVGEGESTMCELAAAMAAGNGAAATGEIRGLAFRHGGKIVRTADRPWLEDLDSLPFPAWHLFPKVFWPVFASRGCPYGCLFCQRVMGRRLRLRSVDNVLAELDALEEKVGQRDAWFQDDTFGVNPKWTDEFLDKLIARNQRKGYVYPWGGNSRANLAEASVYRKMRSSGCYTVSFGVESGNDEILKRIQKGATCAMARNAIAAAKKAGIHTSAFFIIGHPGETWKTALQTVHMAAKCGADSIAAGVMVPYPGTVIWDMARKGDYGYRLLSEDWRLYDKYFGGALAIRGLSHRQLEFFQVLTYVWHHAYNLRLREFANFALRFRREAVAMLKRLFHRTPAVEHPE